MKKDKTNVEMAICRAYNVGSRKVRKNTTKVGMAISRAYDIGSRKMKIR
jgi:hypothetical protein